MKYLEVFENFINEVDPYGEENWEDDNPICYLIFRHQEPPPFGIKKYFFISEFHRDKKAYALSNNENGDILEFTVRIKSSDDTGWKSIQRLTLGNKSVDGLNNGEKFINCPNYRRFKYTLDEIRQNLNPNLPIIFLTRENMEEYGGQCYRTTSFGGPH